MLTIPLEPIPQWFIDIAPLEPISFLRTPQPWSPYVYHHIAMPLRVILSGRVEADGRRWYHVSCSRKNRLPSWEELRMVKDAFIGRDKRAFQVLPPESEYVNVHPYVLHLWHCIDGEPLPDFRIDGQV